MKPASELGLVVLAHRIEKMAPTAEKRWFEGMIREIADRLNILERDYSFALDKLEAKGLLLDRQQDEKIVSASRMEKDPWATSLARRNIGALFYVLHMRQGLPVPPGAQDNGYVTPPNSDDILARMQERERRLLAGEPELTPEQRDWLDRKRYKALLNAAGRAGRGAGSKSRSGERLIISVCIAQKLPEPAQIRQLLHCLDGMRSANLPSAQDAYDAATTAR